ncbi:putative DNA replication complex GINS protein PSF2 [Porphyridium purpureum]|uniref:Putative DNA replication complex GINS protein PSF2 n=1 Tax=Porphyridium purpureum TaxID=35688 RepID=A0A5J4Z324_PORPP|nr:putative DNA replication complex GINS protein PSF2 [Porphyridium purpureum]|eukprot:POR7715..scf295_1
MDASEENEVLLGGPAVRYLELEHVAMEQLVVMVPNFSMAEQVHLICGDYGPFEAGIPMQVPLWLALSLKKLKKCRIAPPFWMEVPWLARKLEEEQREKNLLQTMPPAFLELSSVLLHCAPDDIPHLRRVRFLLEDITNVRANKLRATMRRNITADTAGAVFKFNDLSRMEIARIQPSVLEILNSLHALSSGVAVSREQNTGPSSSPGVTAPAPVGPAAASTDFPAPRGRDLRRFRS